MSKSAKRRLRDFNFEQKGSHVALVGPAVGGPANGYTTLVTKATSKLPKEFIQKAADVKLELSMEEFLRMFFGMWYDDAEVLATILGYDNEANDNDDPMDTYQSYIDQKVQSVTLLKQLFRSVDLMEKVSELSLDQFESVLQDQQLFEKSLSSLDDIKGGVSKKNEARKEDNKEMSDETMIEKSKVESLVQKAVEDAIAPVKAELDQANTTIETYKQAQKEAVAGARKQVLKDVVKDDEKVEEVFKATESLDDAAFKSVLAVMKASVDKLDDSPFFTEKGVAAEGQPVEKSSTQKILEAKYAK